MCPPRPGGAAPAAAALLLPRRTLRASALGLRLRVPARGWVAPPATRTQQHEAEVSAALLGSSRIPPTLRLGVPGVGGWLPGGFGRGWPRRPDVWLETTLPSSP